MRARRMTVALLACAAIALADDRDEAKYTEKAEKSAMRWRERILAAAAALTNHPWAGAYYAGDGLGVNVSLLLAPGAGYVFEWHGCLGLYDRNYGAITETNGRIRLSFTFTNERKGFQGIAEEFIPVAWGARVYLIPSDDVVGFCNKVNEGTEPRDAPHGFYLLRRGDEKKDVTDFPGVPQSYRAYLLGSPITAEIISINSVTTRPSVCEWKFRDTSVTVSAGAAQGLRIGMEMQVIQPRNVVESVTITHVEQSTAQAIMTQAGEESSGPEAGWQLSTRCRWAKERRTTP